MELKKIFLTFDDGPMEPYTSQVLEVLASYNAKATFFVCGKNVERSPESLQRIAQAGHSIGIHTYSHNPWKVIAGVVYQEILDTQTIIQKYTGVKTYLYRSPWGITMPWLKSRLLREGFKIFHWNVMAYDWWQPSATYIANHIVKLVKPGFLVLLHDGDQTRLGNRQHTVLALKQILQELPAEQYTFESLVGYNGQAGGYRDLLKDILQFWKQ